MSGSDTISDAVIGGAGEGAIGDAIRASRRKKHNRESAFPSPSAAGICSNCDTKLNGPVCHSCGQTADTYHRPIWSLLADIADGLFGVEGRLWRTLPPLMLRPGRLTRHYLSGVRARYVMPFRLFLTASLIFFLFFFAIGEWWVGAAAPGEASPEEIAAARTDLEDLNANLSDVGIPPEVRARVATEVERSLQQAAGRPDLPPEVRRVQAQQERDRLKHTFRVALLPEDYPEQEATASAGDVSVGEGLDLNLSALQGWPRGVRARLADSADRVIDTDGQALWAAMRTWAPRLVFGLLPIYALLLAATHMWQRGYFFYDHLVVSLHFHAFLFFSFLLLVPARLAIGAGWAAVILLLWSNFYLYRLHRVVYRHGRISSALRTVFLDVVYAIILGVALFVLVLVGFVMA